MTSEGDMLTAIPTALGGGHPVASRGVDVGRVAGIDLMKVAL